MTGLNINFASANTKRLKCYCYDLSTKVRKIFQKTTKLTKKN